MKIIKNRKLLFTTLFVSTLLFTLSSCVPGNMVTPVVPIGSFIFHLHTYIDNTEVDAYNIDYKTLDGRKISLSISQLYISGIQLVKVDGSTYDFSGKNLLKVLDKETYLVGDVPVGNYKSIRFKVGLDAATNAVNPVTSADSGILNKSAMWFGSAAQPDGYVFMNVQGTIDTSAGMNKPSVPFAYKIGTNTNYKQITMSDKPFSVLENQVALGHILIDNSKLFNSLTLNQSSNLSVTTASANSSGLAAKIVNNMPSMFVYEQ